jgi:hypothetical protein
MRCGSGGVGKLDLALQPAGYDYDDRGDRTTGTAIF